MIVQFPGTARVELADGGGKAVNLVRLAAAGLPVPPGFVVTTAAYRAFVAANRLDDTIAAALTDVTDEADAARLEQASARIREAFSRGDVPADVAAGVVAAMAPYEAVPVAVRSSATAEDLPDLSFAGQQDTYLNVVGADAVLRAVVDCWASLWTARAIGYRLRARVPQRDVALAVVVQTLVAADVSGVLFTADPVTGRRDRVVVDATYGLGEALVSGQVEPDHFVVADGGVVVERTAGAKAVATVPRPGGGVDTVAYEATDRLTLTDAQLVELAALGRQVEAAQGSPQDVEWAWADGRLWLLQARAITSLFPLPEATGWDGFAAWLSFGSVQGMLEPVTPLGQDALRLLALGLYRLVGGPATHPDALPFLQVAGERLWIRADRALRSPLGHRLLPRLLRVGDPAAAAIVANLDEPRLQPPADAHGPRARLRGLRGLRPAVPLLARVAARLPVLVTDPARLRRRVEHDCEALVAAAVRDEAEASRAAPGEPRLRARVDAMERSLRRAFATMLPAFGPVMAPNIVAQRRIAALGGPAALATLRSLEGNVTTAMDLALWRVAETVRADPDALARFTAAAPAELAADYRAGRLGPAVTDALDGFLASYGMRGVGEIDLGHPRWRDDPTGVMASLQGYAALPDDASPAAAYERGRIEARDTLERIVADLRRQGPLGRLRARELAFLVSRVRATFGARETPKLTIVRILGVTRTGLIASGAELVAAGRLEHGDDVVLLRAAELRTAWRGDPDDLRALVAQRRATYEREARRARVPRLLLGDGRTFFEGLTGDGALVGSPVSPGVAEGRVRVVLAPTEAGLQPGEIMVCPGTDPAWTPLFLTASGLVMEVGGMMTHGAVVAREYGLPAVVGVHEATTRLRTGQRIRIDGATGAITLLD